MKRFACFILLLCLLLPLAACGGEGQAAIPHMPPAPPLPPRPDIHGTIPEPPIPWLRNEALTLEEAKLDSDFGPFVPRALPEEFYLQAAVRLVAADSQPWRHWQVTDGMYLQWGGPMQTIGVGRFAGQIELFLSKWPGEDSRRIVSIENAETWDLSFRTEGYPITDAMASPLFHAEHLTLEIVEARIETVDARYQTGAAGFGVLFGDVLMEIRAENLSPEQIWAMFEEIIRRV